jgi:hypothetical protein
MDKKQEYWNILNNINEWIRYSDTKAVILLTLYGVIITIIYSNANEVLLALNSSDFIFYLAILSIILSFLSVLFSLLCVNPRLKNKNPNSVIYFGHIQEKFKTPDEYLVKSNEILDEEKDYLKELSEQVFSNSNIAWKKFSNVTWSLRFFASSIFILLGSILIYLV